MSRAEKIINCPRCNKRCLATETTRPDARPLRKALKGMCLECCVSALFQDIGENGMGHALPPDFDPNGLRLPHIQRQFARVLEVGMSEANMDEIDWDEVIANWELPFPGKIKTAAPRRLF